MTVISQDKAGVQDDITLAVPFGPVLRLPNPVPAIVSGISLLPGLASVAGIASSALQSWSSWGSSTPAQRINSGVASISADTLKSGVVGLVSLGGLVGALGQGLSPRGPGTCDRNACERCCNVCTSLPYCCCGVHAMSKRRTHRGRTWGAGMVAVGIASMIFHSSYGDFREWGRRMDFWTISATSNLMTRALFPNVPAALTAAGMMAVPFKPFLVSTLNSVAMELLFLKRAHENPKLRTAQRIHAACCGLGLCAFALEDARPNLPLVHGVWHCLSSTAVCTLNALMADVEQRAIASGQLPEVGSKRCGRSGAGGHRRQHRDVQHGYGKQQQLEAGIALSADAPRFRQQLEDHVQPLVLTAGAA